MADQVSSIPDHPVSVCHRLPGPIQAAQIKEKGNPGKVRCFGLRGDLNSLIQSRHRPVRVTLTREELGMLDEGPAKPVLEVAPKILDPMVPMPGAGQAKMLENRPSPQGPCFLDLPGRESLRKPAQVNLQRPFPQGERVMVLEDLFPQSVPNHPEGLANGMASLLPLCSGPQQIGQLVSRYRGTMACHIDKKSQRLPHGKGNQIAVPIDDFGRA